MKKLEIFGEKSNQGESRRKWLKYNLTQCSFFLPNLCKISTAKFNLVLQTLPLNLNFKQQLQKSISNFELNFQLQSLHKNSNFKNQLK